MNIKIKKNWEIKENKVTDEKVFLTRRNVVKIENYRCSWIIGT